VRATRRGMGTNELARGPSEGAPAASTLGRLHKSQDFHNLTVAMKRMAAEGHSRPHVQHMDLPSIILARIPVMFEIPGKTEEFSGAHSPSSSRDRVGRSPGDPGRATRRSRSGPPPGTRPNSADPRVDRSTIARCPAGRRSRRPGDQSGPDRIRRVHGTIASQQHIQSETTMRPRFSGKIATV
jgi:hypothetical protein